MSRKDPHGKDPEERFTAAVPLLDVGRENEPLEGEFHAAIQRVYRSGGFVLGPECQALEARMAQLCGTDHAIGCASGSDALLLALMAHGVGPGDEVIVPSFTFFATASAVCRLGARPVFVDIEPSSFNLDPALLTSLITPSTRAIIPVHLFGQCADMAGVREVAEQHGLVVIEDVAQAIGAKWQGQPAGSMGRVGCFSFYPTKNLGGWGDGGMLTTSDGELAERLRLLRVHGMQPRYFHKSIGINSRLDSIQAAVLNVKLNHLPAWNAQRQANAARYRELFAHAGLNEHIQLPSVEAGCDHVWNQFTIRIRHNRRDELRLYLTAAEIGTEIYYPVPLHCQECFQDLDCGEGSLPVTELAAREVLSLPIFPALTSTEQETVVHRISQFFHSVRHGAGQVVIAPTLVATPHLVPHSSTQ